MGADPRTRDIPVRTIIASAMPHDRPKILGAAFDGYKTKLITVKGLVETVATMLGAGRRGRS